MLIIGKKIVTDTFTGTEIHLTLSLERHLDHTE